MSNEYTVDDAIKAGIDRMKRDRDLRLVVFTDLEDDGIVVQTTEARRPLNIRVEAELDRWDAETIQVRRTGGQSDFVKV